MKNRQDTLQLAGGEEWRAGAWGRQPPIQSLRWLSPAACCGVVNSVENVSYPGYLPLIPKIQALP